MMASKGALIVRMHIDTIPVWDAYKAGGECPLCRLKLINEANYVSSFIGASVMEPATRVEVNKKGFCLRHNRLMFEGDNKLGLALITHTYMKDTIKALAEGAKKSGAGRRGGLFGTPRGGRAPHGHANNLALAAEALAGTCILCERLDNTMHRYAYTILHMWGHEAEFRKAFNASKGFCIPHCAQLLKLAPDYIGGRDMDAFIKELADLQLNNLSRVADELEWFTQKFDYKNKEKPWGSSRDAVERAILKLRGQMYPDKD
jgi:hypothetical protein